MTKKEFKKKLKRTFSREKIIKIIVLISTLALIATSFLPYILA